MTVAVVGASGAVGQEILSILSERDFKIDKLYLFGSEKSAGRKYKFKGEEVVVRLLKHGDAIFGDVDLFFSVTDAEVIKEYKDEFVQKGAYVIDNSSAFRLDPEVPLLIPEINITDLQKDCYRKSRLIANPNCSTIIMDVPLYAIHKLSPIKNVHVATYQAVSGIGYHGMEELEQQYYEHAHKQSLTVTYFPHQIIGNVFPHVDKFLPDGYSGEETKMSRETQKIFGTSINISATCVRIPVLRCHSESVWVETEKELDTEQVRAAIKIMPGCVLQDDPEHNVYPMPASSTKKDAICVGRIRKDPAFHNGTTFWCVGDQLRKGAALNAIQIAEQLSFR